MILDSPAFITPAFRDGTYKTTKTTKLTQQ